MTLGLIGVTLFYFSLAVFALAATWRDPGARQVGATLFACWIASNATYWTVGFAMQPLVFPIIDTIFALTCAKAGRETGDYRVTATLIALSVLAICANAVYAWHTAFGIPTTGIPSGTFAYVIILNAVFAAQCLITGGWGIGRVVGFAGIPGHRRGAAQLHRHTKT